jgi:adenine-specific DNA-methyltransferase
MTTINKQELANKIKTIDGLSSDEKSQLLELLHKQKKYGLVWEDKPEDIEEKLRNELPVEGGEGTCHHLR